MKTKVISYDKNKYDFESVIKEYIGEHDLELLTTSYSDGEDRSGNSLYKNMEQSPLFQRMYAGLQGPKGHHFYDLYERFIKEVIRPQYDGPIYYQTRPSHRILFADTPGESRFHRDGDYGHDPGEVNYLVVQTRAHGHNAMWIETEEGKGDYHPLNLEVGEYGTFKGVKLSHGAKANDTGKSRVSFDFRVIPADIAPERYRKGEEKDKEGNPVRDNALSFTLCP